MILEARLLLALPLVFYRGFAEQSTSTQKSLAQGPVAVGLAARALGLLFAQSAWMGSVKLGPHLGRKLSETLKQVGVYEKNHGT